MTSDFSSIMTALSAMLPGDTLLSRRELAEASSKAGLPVAEASLANMASRGVGPRFIRYGRAVRYRWGDFLTWAAARSTVGTSTSAHRAQREAA